MVCVILGSLLLGGAPANAASVSDDLSPAGQYSSNESLISQGKGTGGSSTFSTVCNFTQNGDYPHISSDGSGQLSAHGWWRNFDCKATHGKVNVQIQVQNWAGFWFDVGTPGEATVTSGGGSGNRATARYNCDGTNERNFRARVSVDVIGIPDATNETVSGNVPRNCG